MGGRDNFFETFVAEYDVLVLQKMADTDLKRTDTDLKRTDTDLKRLTTVPV